MTFIVRPGKYLIEKSRRRVIGVISRVGTGGSVPRAVQESVDSYVRSLGHDHIAAERETIRAGMKQMQGTWLVFSPGGGIRWAYDAGQIPVTLRNSGWKPPKEQLAALLSEK